MESASLRSLTLANTDLTVPAATAFFSLASLLNWDLVFGFAFAVIALNLHRAAVPIEVCFRVPASSMRLPRLLHGRIFGLAQPYLS